MNHSSFCFALFASTVVFGASGCSSSSSGGVASTQPTGAGDAGGAGGSRGGAGGAGGAAAGSGGAGGAGGAAAGGGAGAAAGSGGAGGAGGAAAGGGGGLAAGASGAAGESGGGQAAGSGGQAGMSGGGGSSGSGGCPPNAPQQDCVRTCGAETGVMCCPQDDSCLTTLADGCVSLRRCTSVGDGACGIGSGGTSGYMMAYNPEPPVSGWACSTPGLVCHGSDFGMVFGPGWTATCAGGVWSSTQP